MGRKPSLFRGAVVGGLLGGGGALLAHLPELAELQEDLEVQRRVPERGFTSGFAEVTTRFRQQEASARTVAGMKKAAAAGAVVGVILQGLRRLDYEHPPRSGAGKTRTRPRTRPRA